MMIERELLFQGSLGQSRLQVLFNPANILSFIREDLAKKMAVFSKLPGKNYPITAYKKSLNAEYTISLCFEIDQLVLSDTFEVAHDLPAEVIIGDSTLRKWGIKLDMEQGKVITNPRAAEIIIQGLKGYRRIKQY